MNKLTIKPGNGLNSPNKGEYVKINLKISDKKGKSIFDSKTGNFYYNKSKTYIK